MPLHAKVFWGVSFFLVGTLSGSLFSALSGRFLFSIGLGLLAAFILIAFRRYWLGALALCIILGAGHYFWFDARQAETVIPIGQKVALTGLVEGVSLSDSNQSADVRLALPQRGKIRITLSRYPELRYGDVINMSGTVKDLPAAALNYYRKEGIAAVMSFPKIEITSRDQGSAIKRSLYALRNRVASSFSATLPPESATFMTGLILGKSAGFSKSLREELKITGTTHLVALSGYNVTILATSISALLGFLWFSRRAAFIISMFGIAAFVIMTGAQASVVRAGIMAIIVLIATQSGRLFIIKNAVAIAAFLMVLQNPKVLAFDIGFQLSFAALLGIVYLQPALGVLFKTKSEKGFLSWRSNVLQTTAAQLAVLPILLSSFGFASLLSILPNILILAFVPTTMLFGLLIFLGSLISHYLALIFAIFARVLLGYELGVIHLFSKLKFGISVTGVPLILSILYYVAFLGLIIWAQHKKMRII